MSLEGRHDAWESEMKPYLRGKRNLGRYHRRGDSRPGFSADALEMSNDVMIDSCHVEDAEERRMPGDRG